MRGSVETMPERGSFLFSAFLHAAVVIAFMLGLPRLFDRKIAEDQPIAVQLVNIANETRTNQVSQAQPVPQAKPEPVQSEPQKPTPPPPQAQQAPPPPPPPAQKPEAKAEVPPPTPKPPAPAPKKPADLGFEDMLKNLANRKPAAQQQQAEAPNQKTSLPIAPLAAQLSTSVIDAVRQQIERCWNMPTGAKDAKDLEPEFRVWMNADATVRQAQLLNPNPSNPFFQAAADSAYRALLNPTCQPLPVPLDKYDQWQTFTFTFNPKDVL